jgi:hypothetical protein
MANNYGSHPLKKLGEVTPEMVAKLPQWAQRHIELLEMRLGEARREVQANRTANPPSDFAVFHPGAITGKFGETVESFLPEGRTILCYLDDNKDASYHDRKVLMLRRGGDKSHGYHLEVNCWAGYPAVQPQASNCLRIRMMERP